MAGTVAVAGLAAAGCTATGEREPVREAARAWFAAAAARDGAALCDLLTPAAARSVAAGGKACAEAVGDISLPTGEPAEVQVWSGEAQVRTGTETLFLTQFSRGWRVAAAGCRPRPGLPYDCDVEG